MMIFHDNLNDVESTITTPKIQNYHFALRDNMLDLWCKILEENHTYALGCWHPKEICLFLLSQGFPRLLSYFSPFL